MELDEFSSFEESGSSTLGRDICAPVDANRERSDLKLDLGETLMNRALRGGRAVAGAVSVALIVVGAQAMWIVHLRTESVPTVADPGPTSNPVTQTAAVGDSRRGALLPVAYDMSSLTGTLHFVAADGSDSQVGTIDAPFATLHKAESVSAPGDAIIVRGGTYSIIGQGTTTLDTPNVKVIAYPGELPVFDGSIAAPTKAVHEGNLRYFSYQPMPAVDGEGLTQANLADPMGYYPDQVWVKGNRLRQVSTKADVVRGRFWVDRNSNANPSLGRLYLSAEDSSDMSTVRVSGSHGDFLIISGDGISVEGLRIINHSPAMNARSLYVSSGSDDVVLKNLDFADDASIAFKLAGASTLGDAGLVHNTTVDHVTTKNAGWQGAVILNTDDTTISNSVFTGSNPFGEFDLLPQSGGIKAGKVDRMRVLNSEFTDNDGAGIWWDQSNYDIALVGSSFSGNTGPAVFFETSYGLTMVDNVVISPGTGPAVLTSGSDGMKLVNNTLVGGQDTIAILTDPRSGTFGPENRPCSEHPARYGKGGDLSSCNISYSSDLDLVRPGAYGGGSANLTPGMNWRPQIELLVNNIIANPRRDGICGGTVAVCITGSMDFNGSHIEVPLNEIVNPRAEINGNVYQTTGMTMKVLADGGQQGGFTARNLRQIASKKGFGSSFYKKSVEDNGKFAKVGLVSAQGVPTPRLTAMHAEAAPAPTDEIVNLYVAAGTRHYGALN